MDTTTYSNNNFGAYAKKACRNYRLYWLAQMRNQENIDYIEDNIGGISQLTSSDRYSVEDTPIPFELTATEMCVVTIYAEGYNLREVAQMMGKNYSYIRSVYSNAKRKLYVRRKVVDEI